MWALVVKQNWKTLLIAVLTTCISIVGYLQYNFIFTFGIPIILIVLVFAVFRLDKFAIIVGALAPLSINVLDLGVGFGMAFPTEPFIIIIFLALILYFLKESTLSYYALKHPLVLIMICYVLWLWICAANSVQPLVSIKYAISKTWYIVVFFFGGLLWFTKFNNVRLFIIVQTLATVALCLYTIILHAQYGFSREASYGIMYPFFPDHTMYAACLAFIIPPILSLIFNPNSWDISIFKQNVGIGFLLIIVFAVITCFTRATWISLVAALGVYVLLTLKIKFKYIMLVLSCVVLFFSLNIDTILYKLEGNRVGSSDDLESHLKSVSNISTDPSNLERINRWSCALRMVEDKPLFGFGPGTFVFQYGAFQKSDETTLISTFFGDLGDAHSEYFSALAETGFIGLMLWLLILFYSSYMAFKLYNTIEVKIDKKIVLASFLALITYYVHCFLNNYSQYDKIGIPLWTFLSILTCIDIKHARLKEWHLNTIKKDVIL